MISGKAPFLIILILSLSAEAVPIAQQQPQSVADTNMLYPLHSDTHSNQLCITVKWRLSYIFDPHKEGPYEVVMHEQAIKLTKE